MEAIELAVKLIETVKEGERKRKRVFLPIVGEVEVEHKTGLCTINGKRCCQLTGTDNDRGLASSERGGV